MIISIFKNKKPLSEISVLNEDLLNGSEILIGRESDCHIRLDSYQISRYHAALKVEDNKAKINLMSEYGNLKVNGSDRHESELEENDKVDIGEYSIYLKEIPVAESEINYVVTEDKINDIVEDLQEFPVELNDPISVVEEVEAESVEDEEIQEENSGFEIEDDEITVVGDVQDLEEDEENENFNLSEENEFEQSDESGDPFSTNDSFGDEFGDDQFNDGEFSEDDGYGESSGDMSDDKTQVFMSFAKYSLKIFGEFAPFDRFVLEEGEYFIGRDPEKCQIVLDDQEVSKQHAVIKRTKTNCILEDLNSANGIIHNGERINKVDLLNGDEFIIGETTFTVEVASDIIEAEKGALMPVEDDQEVEIEEVVEEEVDFNTFEDAAGTTGVEEKSLIKRILKDPKKKKIAILAGIIIVVVLFLPNEAPKKEQKKSNAQKTANGSEASKKDEKVRDPITMERLAQNYALAYAKFNEGEYYLAKEYIDIVLKEDPNYKDSQTLSKLIKEGLDELVKSKAKEQEEKERRERQIKINALLEKAKESVKNREVTIAKNYFNQIFELDPENIDVPPLKLEIEAYEEEVKRKKEEEVLKKAERQGKVDKLAPGKALYLKGDWYKAIDSLEKFLLEKNMDEDLIAEGTTMLKESKRKLLLIVSPLLSKARSFKEGQDLKQSYETYGEVLKYDPINEEALNERDTIFQTLENRSKKIYREALVAESLSLFNKAKEKFQEVQQISPINSEYYNKATEKLRNYLE